MKKNKYQKLKLQSNDVLLLIAGKISNRHNKVHDNEIVVKQLAAMGYKVVLTKTGPVEQKFFSNIYKKGGEIFFIKSIPNKEKVYRNKLVYEYKTSNVLYRILAKRILKIGTRTLATPKPIKLISNDKITAIVYEYIKKDDTKVTKDTTETVLSGILQNFSKISKLENNEKYEITKISKPYMLFSIPVLIVLAIFSNPRKILKTIEVGLRALLGVIKFKSSQLIITHRDLSSSNLIINRKTVYIIDLEQLVLTVPSYDISDLAINHNPKYDIVKIIETSGQKPNRFISDYIVLNKGLSNKHVNKRFKWYLNKTQTI